MKILEWFGFHAHHYELVENSIENDLATINIAYQCSVQAYQCQHCDDVLFMNKDIFNGIPMLMRYGCIKR